MPRDLHNVVTHLLKLTSPAMSVVMLWRNAPTKTPEAIGTLPAGSEQADRASSSSTHGTQGHPARWMAESLEVEASLSHPASAHVSALKWELPRIAYPGIVANNAGVVRRGDAGQLRPKNWTARERSIEPCGWRSRFSLRERIRLRVVSVNKW